LGLLVRKRTEVNPGAAVNWLKASWEIVKKG